MGEYHLFSIAITLLALIVTLPPAGAKAGNVPDFGPQPGPRLVYQRQGIGRFPSGFL